MMPFRMGEQHAASLPKEFWGYWSLIEACGLTAEDAQRRPAAPGNSRCRDVGGPGVADNSPVGRWASPPILEFHEDVDQDQIGRPLG